MLDGNAVPVESIRGVLTRLYAVTEHELPQIAPEERAYVASEMTAFLLAWLASLRCPVLNRPTASSLCGPSWSTEQWLIEGARAGLRVEPLRRVLPAYFEAARTKTLPAAVAPDNDATEATSIVTFVGPHHCLASDEETVDASTLAAVQRLADAAKVELLSLTFVGGPGRLRLVSAVPWVEPTRPEVADALLDRLERAP